jgi:hypothetical protein
MAYSLLGLMNVNMPMLYGEGTKAFYRLQVELLNQANDHSIFAWHNPSERPGSDIGMLASSPAYFAQSANIASRPDWPDRTIDTEYEMTKKGLRIQLPLVRYTGNACTDILEPPYLAFLNCRERGARGPVVIWLCRMAHGRYCRIAPSESQFDVSPAPCTHENGDHPDAVY